MAKKGETTLRVTYACKDLNIKYIAVYTEAEAGSLYRRLADGQVFIDV